MVHLRVHDERAVLDDGLANGLAGNQQEPERRARTRRGRQGAAWVTPNR